MQEPNRKLLGLRIIRLGVIEAVFRHLNIDEKELAYPPKKSVPNRVCDSHFDRFRDSLNAKEDEKESLERNDKTNG
jgi:hypothetical protein